jgi:hypothetical protein
MLLRLQVSQRYEASLAAHLAEQGFPAVRAGAGELRVLFPGSASIFAAAAELDLCEARGGCCVDDLVIAEAPLRREIRRSA